MVYCVYSLAILMRTHNIPPCYKQITEILIMPPGLALLSTLIDSNNPCLEIIFMVPKMFEPLKFDCIYFYDLNLRELTESSHIIDFHSMRMQLFRPCRNLRCLMTSV